MTPRRLPLTLLSRSTVAALAITVATVCTTIPAAQANPPHPFNLQPAPRELPRDVDSAIPAPAIPRLASIPARSRTPGTTHRFQELRDAIMPSPSGDPFFDHWPGGLDSLHPGELIMSRSVAPVAGPLIGKPTRYIRQIKFGTRDTHGHPIFGTATLFVPSTPWRGPGARPVVVNSSPIVALATKCTPGYTMSHGVSIDTNDTDFRPPATPEALARGYAVIMPDHTGPRMAYAEPMVAGHVVLDALRAAAAYDARNYAAGPIGLIGYSGGSIATNAAARLAPGYAPELVDRLVGAAIGGVPADFRALAGAMNANLGSGVFLAGVLGVARERPEILAMANNLGRQLATNAYFKNLCSGDMGYLGAGMTPAQVLATDPDPFRSPLAEEIYAATSMRGMASATPMYIYQGAQEWWIPEAPVRALFDEQCRLGVNATYRTYFGEHMSTMYLSFPDAMRWLSTRLSGRPPVSNCP